MSLNAEEIKQKFEAGCDRIKNKPQAIQAGKAEMAARGLDVDGVLRSLNLDRIPAPLRDHARDEFLAGDAVGFLITTSNTQSISIVWDNMYQLYLRGIYDEALLHAIISTRTNNYDVKEREWRTLFSFANRERFRAAGEPLPGAGPFTLYRGTHGDKRYIRGLSWTLSLEQARWFMTRGLGDQSNAAVYTITIPAEHVWAYTNQRDEQEMIVRLTGLRITPRKVDGIKPRWMAAS